MPGDAREIPPGAPPRAQFDSEDQAELERAPGPRPYDYKAPEGWVNIWALASGEGGYYYPALDIYRVGVLKGKGKGWTPAQIQACRDPSD